MKSSYFLLVNNKGRSLKVYHSHLLVGLMTTLILLLLTVYFFHSMVQVKKENSGLLNKLDVKASEINTFASTQTNFENYINDIESELSSIKKNFETYKTEVEQDVRKK
jgi:peptidoglycan hydrolase CwlO-like protein